MTSLTGVRVLVVEDEAPVLMLVTDILEEFGCEVAATAASLSRALELAARGGFDLALLDVNLAGERVFPVADLLAGQGVPFIFVTGYGAAGIRDDLRSRPVVAKPFAARDLQARMEAVLNS